MRISLVVAASTNNVIGRDGDLPWRISEDLKHFRKITMGLPIIMGRRTFESIGRALPGRRNIVLTTQADFVAEDCVVVNSPAAALQAAGDASEVMVIGGGEIYALFLPMAARIHLTRVDANIDGDAYFPALDPEDWRLVQESESPDSDAGEYAYRFQTFERSTAPVAG